MQKYYIMTSEIKEIFKLLNELDSISRVDDNRKTIATLSEDGTDIVSICYEDTGAKLIEMPPDVYNDLLKWNKENK